MVVTYTIRGQLKHLQISATDQLHEMAHEIEQQLRATLKDLKPNPKLQMIVADNLLNALADGSDTTFLGEVAAPRE